MSVRRKPPAAQTVAPTALRRHFVGCVEDAILHIGLAEVKKVVARHTKTKRK
ncbi:hypothetical protein ABIF65_003766 [Bradyrhizobium japonicum]|uniref:hypothetical protein n=1 Tax=Bradyrhizobium liaoningense TaxID=43992 RepID=UPI001BA713A3|nr:hypothetical protein [Bradyrhizobium liaoningense]MBR0998752.1 hypothetical protein [Bradyrhizobium liaoningense]